MFYKTSFIELYGYDTNIEEHFTKQLVQAKSETIEAETRQHFRSTQYLSENTYQINMTSTSFENNTYLQEDFFIFNNLNFRISISFIISYTNILI